MKTSVIEFSPGESLSLLHQLLNLYSVDYNLSQDKGYVLINNLSKVDTMAPSERYTLTLIEVDLGNLQLQLEDNSPKVMKTVCNFNFVTNQAMQKGFKDTILTKYLEEFTLMFPEYVEKLTLEELISCVHRDVLNPVYGIDGRIAALTSFYSVKCPDTIWNFNKTLEN